VSTVVSRARRTRAFCRRKWSTLRRVHQRNTSKEFQGLPRGLSRTRRDGAVQGAIDSKAVETGPSKGSFQGPSRRQIEGPSRGISRHHLKASSRGPVKGTFRGTASANRARLEGPCDKGLAPKPLWQGPEMANDRVRQGPDDNLATGTSSKGPRDRNLVPRSVSQGPCLGNLDRGTLV
jgi:hypothetical protein